MPKKHHLIRAAREININGRVYQEGDVVAHLIGDMTPRQFGALMSNRDACQCETRDSVDLDTEDASPEEEQSEPEGPAEPVEGPSAEDEPVAAPEPTADQDAKPGVIDRLVADGIPQSIAEELAASVVGSLPEDELVADAEMLGTADGIRAWQQKHGDLTQISGIGPRRAKAIEQAISQ